jgi:hypothetical protein
MIVTPRGSAPPRRPWLREQGYLVQSGPGRKGLMSQPTMLDLLTERMMCLTPTGPPAANV